MCVFISISKQEVYVNGVNKGKVKTQGLVGHTPTGDEIQFISPIPIPTPTANLNSKNVNENNGNNGNMSKMGSKSEYLNKKPSKPSKYQHTQALDRVEGLAMQFYRHAQLPIHVIESDRLDLNRFYRHVRQLYKIDDEEEEEVEVEDDNGSNCDSDRGSDSGEDTVYSDNDSENDSDGDGEDGGYVDVEIPTQNVIIVVDSG